MHSRHGMRLVITARSTRVVHCLSNEGLTVMNDADHHRAHRAQAPAALVGGEHPLHAANPRSISSPGIATTNTGTSGLPASVTPTPFAQIVGRDHDRADVGEITRVRVDHLPARLAVAGDLWRDGDRALRPRIQKTVRPPQWTASQRWRCTLRTSAAIISTANHE
jgi:hypothetical protein